MKIEVEFGFGLESLIQKCSWDPSLSLSVKIEQYTKDWQAKVEKVFELVFKNRVAKEK